MPDAMGVGREANLGTAPSARPGCREPMPKVSPNLWARARHGREGLGLRGRLLARNAGPNTIAYDPIPFVNLWRFADEQLAKTKYLAGDEITAADLAVYPIYAGRKALPDNAGLKHLQAWGARIGSRPGVQKGMKLET
jgi:glutathione S-transferase